MHFQKLLLLFSNPLFSGGFLLMISGAVMALCRGIPAKFWAWFKRQCVVEVTVLSDDPIFEWVSIWLNEHPYSKKTRSLIASSLSTESDSADDYHRSNEPRIIFSPARGDHFFVYQGRLIWLHRGKDSDTPSSGKSQSVNLRKEVESYNIRVLGRKQDVIRALIEDAQKVAREITASKLNIYICGGYGWSRLHSTVPRSLDTVILPDGETKRLLNDITTFRNRPEWYRQRGIPYHRGYLLYGLAGSGKTSVITALAGELHMSLYVMSVSGLMMDDERLIDSFRQVPKNSIILLEDVDAVTFSRHKDTEKNTEDSADKKANNITLSGILNCLDGVMAKNGCLVFMTTNHIERLDKALIRPGRVDYKLEFKEADFYQISTMYDNFSITADTADVVSRTPFINRMLAEKATTAKVQEELMVMFD